MKMLCLTIFACLACYPCSSQVHVVPINAVPSGDVMLRDPMDTQRIVGATRLIFRADKTYLFTVRYSGQDTYPPLRLTIYGAAQHEAAADCRRVLCWTEWIF